MKKAKVEQVKEIRLVDYQPPAFLVDHVDLDFDIGPKATRVSSSFAVRRNPAHANKKAPLTLDGENQRLKSVKINGIKLTAQNYTLTDKALVIDGVPDEALIEIESTNEPAKNTALMGLYAAGDMLCTQCEAEGFRRITYYPDRPDVLAKYRVTIHADKKKYPVLLSNGNLIKKGSEGKTRHYAIWEDPFAKPCYLFALVAGKMDKVTDHHVTKSGRKILLEIYVESGKKKETSIAMKALKDSMAWDEKTYGLEYDLDRFMIVAVSFFNMGAMENKGLNIFNDACVLGRAETATDGDIAFFERVVGHEYFHNYTGDRVTCRDWFQLSLKEGLTVFREQEFCGDMNSRALERLKSVVKMRQGQFPEDAGAMAHPIRPASYQAIDNFYTSTVYQKGAEVVRMLQTLMGGRAAFRKGLRLYLKRHDGQAATCEDFVLAMADASGLELDQFMLWYSQAGTPVLDVTSSFNKRKKEYTLHVKQSCPPTPGQKTKKPMNMPFSVGLLDKDGKDMKGTFVLDLVAPEENFVFLNVEEEPTPSLLRDFSAPVRLNYDYTDAQLLLLMAHDTDGFNRWEAGQKLFTKYLLEGGIPPQAFIEALRKVVKNKKLDAATKTLMLSLPTEGELGLTQLAMGQKIDPIALYYVRQVMLHHIATGLRNELWATYEQIEETLDERAIDGQARGLRSFKNLCLSYLNKVEEETVAPLAASAVTGSRNMTDKIAGLSILSDGASSYKAKSLNWFAMQYKGQPTIMDHWLGVQASARRDDVLFSVKKLLKHPAFSFKNPNRIGALINVFAGNPLGFHAEDGSGYNFIAEMILKIDPINPHAAARLVGPFLRMKDYTPKRQKLMKAALQNVAKQAKLSPNVREKVTKALKASTR
ncbi:MAG: aminopeptidase N [Proteobacteria bacterium]|jgi:aminopeptidase N|nr:aminopeptidase N [Alphaproteobacteria bacterium]NCC03678.1 aminopeptidase N [Pseudomonadota bacterium]